MSELLYGQFARWLAFAQDALKRGNLALAEALAGDFLGRCGPVADGLVVVAEVALRVGRPDQAAAWAGRVLEAEPTHAEARGQLARAEVALATYRPESEWPGTRYLVITAWGHGFWSDVDHVLAALLVAELTGRRPVVYWGPDSKYADAGAGNAWEAFFEPVSDVRLEDVLAGMSPGNVYPSKWTPARLRAGEFERMSTDPLPTACALFNRPEAVAVADVHTALIALLSWLPATHRLHGVPLKEAYRDLIRTYLRPRREFTDRVEAFVDGTLRAGLGADDLVMGVHYRGSDKHTEEPASIPVQAQYTRVVDRFVADYPGGRVFLLTDSQDTLAEYQRRYGPRLVTTGSTRTTGSVGLHFQDGHDRARLGAEVLTDVLIAARCDVFLGFAYSNVSCYVEFMKDWPEASLMLLGDYVLGISDAMMLMEPAVRERFLAGLPPT